MRRLAVLLVLLLTIVSCMADNKTITVTMTEAYRAWETVEVSVVIRGTSWEDMTFLVNDIPYQVTQVPSVDAPAFVLESDTAAEKRMTFTLCPDESEPCAILDGNGGQYICHIDEWQELTDWMRIN